MYFWLDSPSSPRVWKVDSTRRTFRPRYTLRETLEIKSQINHIQGCIQGWQQDSIAPLSFPGAPLGIAPWHTLEVNLGPLSEKYPQPLNRQKRAKAKGKIDKLSYIQGKGVVKKTLREFYFFGQHAK